MSAQGNPKGGGDGHSARFAVKIGINPISWSNDDLPSLGGETSLDTALTEGKAIGYQGFELGNKFPRESVALRQVLGAHGLDLVSGWYSGRLARGTVEDEIAAVGPHLKLLADNGAKVMVYGEVADSIQGAPRPLYMRPRFFSERQWVAYGQRLDAFGIDFCQDFFQAHAALAKFGAVQKDGWHGHDLALFNFFLKRAAFNHGAADAWVLDGHHIERLHDVRTVVAGQ